MPTKLRNFSTEVFRLKKVCNLICILSYRLVGGDVSRRSHFIGFFHSFLHVLGGLPFSKAGFQGALL